MNNYPISRGKILTLSHPGTTSIPDYFPLLPATTVVYVHPVLQLVTSGKALLEDGRIRAVMTLMK